MDDGLHQLLTRGVAFVLSSLDSSIVFLKFQLGKF
jgi:hypothetical protein